MIAERKGLDIFKPVSGTGRSGGTDTHTHAMSPMPIRILHQARRCRRVGTSIRRSIGFSVINGRASRDGYNDLLWLFLSVSRVSRTTY